MPHVIIEHSASIADKVVQSKVTETLHHTVIASGLFSPEAVKSRHASYNQVICGEDAAPVDFVHVTVKILDGRSQEDREKLSRSVFDALSKALPDVAKRSVDIHEMDKVTYIKS